MARRLLHIYQKIKVPPCQTGTVFTCTLRGTTYYGKVVKAGVPIKDHYLGQDSTGHVLYIFRNDFDPYTRNATAEDLLVPPAIVRHQEWKRGSFLVAPNLQIDFELPEHAFSIGVSHDGYRRGQLVNEYGQVLGFQNESENSMLYYGFTLEGFEWQIGKALGLFSSHDEWMSLPALERDKGLSTHTYEVKLPFTELEALDLASDDLEDELLKNRKLSKLGELIEAGSSESARHFVFQVPPRRVKNFVNELQLQLKSMGVRNYKVTNCDTDEPVV